MKESNMLLTVHLKRETKTIRKEYNAVTLLIVYN